VFSRSFVRKRVISLATTRRLPRRRCPGSRIDVELSRSRSDAGPICCGSAGLLRRVAIPVENDAAMNKMIANMTVKPTGDVDRDFVAMMCRIIKALSRWRRLNSNTVITTAATAGAGNRGDQQQEIAVMRLAVATDCRHRWLHDQPETVSQSSIDVARRDGDVPQCRVSPLNHSNIDHSERSP